MSLNGNAFLQNCFLIVDLSLCGEDTLVEEDEILFFHPAAVPYAVKSQLYGWGAAMLTFAKSIAGCPLHIADLDKFKVAFLQQNDIALMLTGSADQPSSTLREHLCLVYDAFRFYNRSFQAIAKRYPTRKEFHQKMAEIGRELVPLLTHSFHKNILRTFNPIPYTPLTHKSNRHFIQASQLLNFVEAEPGNISGCVIYKNSIICTHLDFTTTRFVLNRLAYNNKFSLYSSLQPPYSNGGRGRMEPVVDFIPVYMLRQGVEDLIKDRDNMFPFANVPTQSPPPSSSPFSHHQFLQPPAIEEEVEEQDGFVSLGLCTVSVHELSIAVLMTFKAFSNKQHINKSIWKIPADPHFQALESDLEADTMPTSSTGSSGSSGSNRSTSPHSAVEAGSPPLATIFAATSTASSMLPSSDSPNPSRVPPLLYNARIVHSNSYNFLTYDSLTESAAGKIGEKDCRRNHIECVQISNCCSVTPLATTQEVDFAQAVSFMHHSFSSDTTTTEIIRKDSTGEIFGKSIFGREVYYQLKNGANVSHDKFLEVIEKTVRTTVKEDHNINLI